MRLSRYLAISSPIYDQVTGRAERVIFATRTAEVRIVSDELWSLLKAGKFGEVRPDLVRALEEIEVLVSATDDELAVVLGRQRIGIKSLRNLYLVIQPTAACQLGCGYCGQEHSQQRLSSADQDALLRRVTAQLDSGGFDSVEVSWFGAEPLLGIREMRRITRQLQAICDDRGVLYVSKIVTNGLRLNSTISAELVNALNVRKIEVTIDGSAAFHDVRRHTKAAKGTFSTIFANVTRFARTYSSRCQVVVRCNVDSDNYAGVEQLLRDLVKAEVQDKLTFYTAPIHSWGNDAHLSSLQRADYAQREVGWLALMLDLGFTPALLPPLKPVVCLAVMPSGVLIDAYGELFNCTEVSYVPKYETVRTKAVNLPFPTRRDAQPTMVNQSSSSPRNRYAIGHIQSGEVVGTRPLLADFNDRIEGDEVPCSSCRMLPVCGGACPKLWREGLIPCPSTKDNISERLLLLHAAAQRNAPA